VAIRLLTCLWIAAAGLGAEERFDVRYFYDEDRSSLVLRDFAFPAGGFGIAAGAIVGDNGGSKPVALITRDGGVKWSLSELEEEPVSIFFLDDSLGWLVTEDGLWQTNEGGRSWRKLKAPEGVLRVHFKDALTGWAVGTRKGFYQTVDGGRVWTPVPAAAEPKTTREYTSYGSIAFFGSSGMVSGWSRPPRRGDASAPAWLEPEAASRRAEWPGLAIVIETQDSGRSWSAAVQSAFGLITRVALSRNFGLALIEFVESFAYPSEVHRLETGTGKSSLAFREKGRHVTDVAIAPEGVAYLAAIEPVAPLRGIPIPGKLRMLRGTGGNGWTGIPADYRATATRAMLAFAGGNQLWVATDTGMILKLEKH
jgi:photosystem II stability/assembly factor-like uncharacterized protein